MAGATLNNRLLSDRIRGLLLKEVEKILTGEDEKAKRELTMKMATTLLPRLNEHSGPEGQPIPILGSLTISKDAVSKDTSSREDSQS